MELCHEIVEGEGSDNSLVGTVPVLHPVILNSHDDCQDLFVGCDGLVEKVGFVPFTEILGDLGTNLTTCEHWWFGLIALFDRGNVRVGGLLGGHIVIGVIIRGYRITQEWDLGGEWIDS